MAVNQQDLQNIMQTTASRVPYWARSSNPIVRRHLGMGWRTLPPELTPLLKAMGVWAAILVLGLILPFVLDMISTVFLASLLTIPFVTLLYGHILLTVSVSAVSIMQQEIANDTFQLLRATPMSLEQIFLGKVAAAIWQRMDDLIIVAYGIVLLGLPVYLIMYSDVWVPAEQPLLAFVMLMLAMIVALLRVIVEPIMLGMLAVFIGLVVPTRGFSVTATLVIGGFYVALLNLIRYIPGLMEDPLAVLIVDFVLPLLLPVVITFMLLQLAKNIVLSD